MVNAQTIQGKRDAIREIAVRHGAYDIRLFGSMARGAATEKSDVDFLVRFEPRRSLLDHGALVADLEALLGTKVDVIDEDGMRPRFREVVMAEAVPI